MSNNETLWFNKSFLNKRDIKRAYKVGYLDLVAKQLRRYGEITSQHDHTTDSGYHMGEHRYMKITHHNLNWELHLHNGELREIGYKL